MSICQKLYSKEIRNIFVGRLFQNLGTATENAVFLTNTTGTSEGNGPTKRTPLISTPGNPLALFLSQKVILKEFSAQYFSPFAAEIREAFRVLDRDGNGFISKQELGMAMRSLGYMPSEVELAIIMQRLDMDGESSLLSSWFYVKGAGEDCSSFAFFTSFPCRKSQVPSSGADEKDHCLKPWRARWIKGLD